MTWAGSPNWDQRGLWHSLGPRSPEPVWDTALGAGLRGRHRKPPQVGARVVLRTMPFHVTMPPHLTMPGHPSVRLVATHDRPHGIEGGRAAWVLVQSRTPPAVHRIVVDDGAAEGDA